MGFSIEEFRAQELPTYSTEWRISGLDNLGGVGDNNPLIPPGDSLEPLLLEAVIPTPSAGTPQQHIEGSNNISTMGGKANCSDVILTFQLDPAMNARKFYNEWYKRILDYRRGILEVPNRYKSSNIEITELLDGDPSKPIVTHRLIGAFPWSAGEVTAGSDVNLQSFTINFSVDTIESSYADPTPQHEAPKSREEAGLIPDRARPIREFLTVGRIPFVGQARAEIRRGIRDLFN